MKNFHRSEDEPQAIESIESIEAIEATERTSNKLLREALGSYGLNNFENALNAVEDFLCRIELFDPDIAFGQAANAFVQAALVFALIDDNHDQSLSIDELKGHAATCDQTMKSVLEWVLMHHEALCRARLHHHHESVSRRDLLSAANFFSGLEYIHRNFDQIAQHHDKPGLTLTHQDILRHTFRFGKTISAPERRALLQVARYLQQLEQKGSETMDKQTLDELTPESIWCG